MSRLEAVESLLCERYNVRSLDGPLKAAIDADNVAELRELLEQRDLYRWHDAIFAALPGDEAELSRQAPTDTEADEGVAPRRRGRPARVSEDATETEPIEATTSEDEPSPVEPTT